MARELGPGGTERQLTEMARSLDRQRFEAHVACFHEGPRADELRRSGIPVVRLPVRSFMRPSVLSGISAMGRYLREKKIQLVHTFDYPLNCFGVPVARLFRVPVVLSSQRAHRHLTPAPYLRVLRWTDRLVHGIVVNSAAVRLDMIRNEGIAADRLHLCYNGIDIAQYDGPVRTRVPVLAQASLVVGVVCVLRPEKGLATLLRAFAAIAGHDRRMQLVIVGSGPELPSLEALVTELNIRAQCLFHPAVQNVADWMHSIDIFVLPSLSEALSNSLMEAMASGCAAIASETGGNPELIQPGQTGLLFQVGDAEDLTAKLQMLITQKNLREDLARRGAEHIRSHFSLAASVRRLEEIYGSFLPPPTLNK